MKVLLLIAGAAAIATPTLAQPDERTWTFRLDDDLVQLSWAIPDSDDAGPAFTCSPGEGTVRVSMVVTRRVAMEAPTADGVWVDAAGRPAPWKGELELRSGRTTDRYPALVHPDEMNGGSMVEAEIAPETPALEAFGRTGVVVLSSFGETEAPPPAPSAQVRVLLNACLPGS